jgi:hypothetical protein
MDYYSYKIDHDFGLAPNPFWGYCTIAVCKSNIRKNKKLKIGDWIIGTGTKKIKKFHHLIILMQVEEILPMKDYWNDSRFQLKKPVINGSLVQMYGDNFYHFDKNTNSWIQENSAHSLENGFPNDKHLKRDTGGENVLISKNFYYFGNDCPIIPEEYLEVCCEARDFKSTAIPTEIADQFVRWVKAKYEIGIHGDPISWSQYKLSKIDYKGF